MSVGKSLVFCLSLFLAIGSLGARTKTLQLKDQTSVTDVKRMGGP